MKVSRDWLQKEFETTLPSLAEIAEAFTFHSFEIESVEGDVLDVKVLPNRGADCLSVRGIAKELSAILDIPMKGDVLRNPAPAFPATNELVVTADSRYVLRHTGALIRGVHVEPSPAWLKERLESVGQRSVNNIVDVLNYVMLAIGQPSGAFDVGKMRSDHGVLKIDIREAKSGEKIKILTGETLELSAGIFAFTDATSGMLLDVAGIKGGLDSGITEATENIFLSVGNYDGTLLRKASQKLKVFTDASQRYQNRPSVELTAYGMHMLLNLLKEVAGGELVGVVDIYPKKAEQRSVSVTAERVSQRLGAEYTDTDIADVFRRLDLPFMKDGAVFTVTPPFERTDLVIPEDLVEEVGRIIGYDKVPPTVLLPVKGEPDQARFRGIERMKDMLVEKGFIEVSTQSFVKDGEVYLANPLDKSRPALRPTLAETLGEALERAKPVAPLVLPPSEKVRLFEVGTVFPQSGEFVELRMTERVPEWPDASGTSDNLSAAKLEDYGKDYMPKRYELGPYKPFSVYPFALRDVALWCPKGTPSAEPEEIIKEKAGPLLVRCDLFDTFEKGGRISYAFRLVLQAADRTLSDEELAKRMETITMALSHEGWEVR